VLVKNGLEMEAFLDKLVASAEDVQLTVIDSGRGVATITVTVTVTITATAMGR